MKDIHLNLEEKSVNSAIMALKRKAHIDDFYMISVKHNNFEYFSETDETDEEHKKHMERYKELTMYLTDLCNTLSEKHNGRIKLTHMYAVHFEKSKYCEERIQYFALISTGKNGGTKNFEKENLMPIVDIFKNLRNNGAKWLSLTNSTADILDDIYHFGITWYE